MGCINMPKYTYSQYWAMKEKDINTKLSISAKKMINKAKREFERQRRYA
jgi:hypothetical protein